MPLVPTDPDLPSALVADLGSAVWTSSGVYNGAHQLLGRFINANGAVYHLVPARGASAGTDVWAVTTTPPTGITGLLLTSADATILTTGTISGGSVTSGGVTYRHRIWFDATAGWISQASP